MENKDFDNKLKAALEDMEVKMPANAWQKMEQKYHVSIAEEQPEAVAEVDRVVLRKLQNMEVSYRPEAWRRMETVLIANKLILRKIWVTKISELVIASLLLLGWYDATFSTEAQFPKHRQVKPPTSEPIADAKARSKKYASGSAQSGNNEARVDSQNELALDGDGANEGGIFSNIAQSLVEMFNLEGDGASTPVDMVAHADGLASEPNGVTEGALVALLSAQNGVVTPLADVDFMQTLDIAKTSLADKYLPTKPQKPATHWYLGAYGGFGNTQVTSQNLQTSAANPFVTFADAYAGGLFVGARKGNWYLETGVGYSNTNFAPQKQTEIYAGNINEGYYGNQLVNTQYQQIHVPVAIGRKIWKKNRTEVSLKAGVSGNLVANTMHQYDVVYFPGTAPDKGNNTTTAGQRSPQFAQEGKGLLQGGNTSDNLYLTADVAIRAEYALSQKRTKLFAELAHNANVLGTGVGNFEDKLAMTSLRLGVIAAL